MTQIAIRMLARNVEAVLHGIRRRGVRLAQGPYATWWGLWGCGVVLLVVVVPTAETPPGLRSGLAALLLIALVLGLPWRRRLRVLDALTRLGVAGAIAIVGRGAISHVPGMAAVGRWSVAPDAAGVCLVAAATAFVLARATAGGRRSWTVQYIGLWPGIPTNTWVTLSVGQDVRVAWNGRHVTFPIEVALTVQLSGARADAGCGVGFFVADHNFGHRHFIHFACRSSRQEREIAQTLLQAGYEAAAPDWEDRRRLVVSVAAPADLLTRGGKHEATIERTLWCPHCTAVRVAQPSCEVCYGRRHTTEREQVVFIIPTDSRPGRSVVIPHQGNRDANGIAGPLVILLRAEQVAGP